MSLDRSTRPMRREQRMPKCWRVVLGFLAVMILMGAVPSALGQTKFNPDDHAAGGPGFDKPQTNIRPQDVVAWQGFDAVATSDDQVTTLFRLTLKNNWKIYASNLKFAGPPGFEIIKSTPPPSRRFLDPISGTDVDIYDGGEFELVFSGAPQWNQKIFPVSITYVGCTDVICLFPYTEALDLPFSYSAPPTPSTPSPPSQGPEAGTTEPPKTPGSPEGLETSLARQLTQPSSFGLLLLIVFVGGLLSNLTPCVYPMIPITLRVLARQGGSPHLSAAAYGAGIVITYTALGLVASLSGGLFGSLLANKPLNFFFAALMFGLGLTMIGFGDFSRVQMLGQKLGSGKPSFHNTFAMGIGAGFVAAPCTGPILAALLAYTARQDSSVLTSSILLFSYSTGFGLPYMALGGAAHKVTKIKVRPTIQVGVKILFASVMFALSFYYLRIPFYGYIESMRGSWQPLAIGFGTIGLLTLGVWLSYQPLAANKLATILPTTLLGISLFATSQWLTSASASGRSVAWIKDEAEAFRVAEATGKPVLIDMWAEWCEACKKMEVTTFKDPLILDEVERSWVPLKLDLTELDERSEKIQSMYSVQSLPTLVLVPPNKDLTGAKNIGGFVDAGSLIQHLVEYRDQMR